MNTQEEREQAQQAKRAQREEEQRLEEHYGEVSRIIYQFESAFSEPLNALKSLGAMFRDNRTRLTTDETRVFDSISGLIQQSIEDHKREMVAMAYEPCSCPVCQALKDN